MLTLYWAIAAGLSLAYGVWRVKDGPSVTRTMMKAMSVAFLGVIAFFAGGPLLLVVALLLCALGDAFLSMEEKWLQPGIAAFAGGHIIYIVLFINLGAGVGYDVFRIVLQIALLGAAGFYFYWIRSSLGAMRVPVSIYFGIIALMTLLALGLPQAHWLVTLGALMFLVSDAILAAEMFKIPRESPHRRWTPFAVWGLYWGGQALITLGVLHPLRAATL
jgi:uncharacterized membrane protein YhhN